MVVNYPAKILQAVFHRYYHVLTNLNWNVLMLSVEHVCLGASVRLTQNWKLTFSCFYMRLVTQVLSPLFFRFECFPF